MSLFFTTFPNVLQMLDVLATLVWSQLLGFLWYGWITPIAEIWMANAWPGKTEKQIGDMVNHTSLVVVTAVSQTVAMVCFKILHG